MNRKMRRAAKARAGDSGKTPAMQAFKTALRLRVREKQPTLWLENLLRAPSGGAVVVLLEGDKRHTLECASPVGTPIEKYVEHILDVLHVTTALASEEA